MRVRWRSGEIKEEPEYMKLIDAHLIPSAWEWED